MSACSRSTEVNELSSTESPQGNYVAQVKEVVYGPHFGGESPTIEVWLKNGVRSEMLFQAPEGGSQVRTVWQSATNLKIVRSASMPVILFKASSIGVIVELTDDQPFGKIGSESNHPVQITYRN